MWTASLSWEGRRTATSGGEKTDNVYQKQDSIISGNRYSGNQFFVISLSGDLPCRSEAYLSAAEHAAIDFYLTAMEHWRDRRPHSTITFNATPQGLPRYYCSPRGVIIAGNLLVDPDGNVTFGMIFRHEESDTVIRLDRNRNLHRYRRKWATAKSQVFLWRMCFRNLQLNSSIGRKQKRQASVVLESGSTDTTCWEGGLCHLKVL